MVPQARKPNHLISTGLTVLKSAPIPDAIFQFEPSFNAFVLVPNTGYDIQRMTEFMDLSFQYRKLRRQVVGRVIEPRVV